MKRSFYLLLIFLFAVTCTEAQKSKLEGHWFILKLIEDKTDTIVVKPEFFKTLVLKNMNATLKEKGIPLSAADVKTKDSLAGAEGMKLFISYIGIHVQFNADDTYEVRLEDGKTMRGKYTVNETTQIIRMSGEFDKTLSYKFNDRFLNLTSDDGMWEAVTFKRKY
jgi:hypothetical protein